MKKIAKVIWVVAFIGVLGLSASVAHAWGGGPWGGNRGWANDWGPFDGNGFGDFSMNWGGRGSGYGYGNPYGGYGYPGGYGYGYPGGYGYGYPGGYGGGYPGGHGYPGVYRSPGYYGGTPYGAGSYGTSPVAPVPPPTAETQGKE